MIANNNILNENNRINSNGHNLLTLSFKDAQQNDYEFKFE